MRRNPLPHDWIVRGWVIESMHLEHPTRGDDYLGKTLSFRLSDSEGLSASKDLPYGEQSRIAMPGDRVVVTAIRFFADGGSMDVELPVTYDRFMSKTAKQWWAEVASDLDATEAERRALRSKGLPMQHELKFSSDAERGRSLLGLAQAQAMIGVDVFWATAERTDAKGRTTFSLAVWKGAAAGKARKALGGRQGTGP